MKKITEEMQLEKEWFKEAKKQTLDSLPEFLRKLSSDYQHDYGTIVHAISAAALGAAWAMNSCPEGGITGFQAGFVMWDFIREWQERDGHLRLINFNDMLYPQYQDKFEKTISSEILEDLKKRAIELLDKNNKSEFPANHRVINHWQEIANGLIPFGYTVKE